MLKKQGLLNCQVKPNPMVSIWVSSIPETKETLTFSAFFVTIPSPANETKASLNKGVFKQVFKQKFLVKKGLS